MAERVIDERYRLLEPLGVGGMASVWRARDVVLERDVAVKVLAREADRVRFEREARAVALLTHPNIVRLYDFGESGDGPFIVYELVPGGTLEERLRPGQPLPDDDVAAIAGGVAAGLAYAHGQGVVHRDLKPANILFDAEGRPRIADFGIARLAGAGTVTEAGTVLGTAAYISPEQASGQPATPASDVYSFGVILYQLLTGRLPFEADEPMALAAMHVHEAPAPVASIRPDAPVRLESVATAALAKDPADRPPDGGALLAELAGGTATVVAPPPASPRGRRRAPSILAIALAAVLLGAAGAAFAVFATATGDAEPVVATSDELPPITTGTGEETEIAPADEPEAKPEPTTTERQTTERETTEETTTTLPPAPTESLPPPPTESLPPPPTESTPPTTTQG